MTSFEKIKNLILYAGVEKATYNQVLPELMAGNRNTLLVFSGLAIAVTVVMFIASLIVPSLTTYRLVYGTGAIVSLLIFLLSYFKGNDSPALITVLVYIFLICILGVGMYLGTVASPNELTATYIALLLVLPQLFNDRPFKIHIVIVASIAIFIAMVLAIKDPITWNSDIVNSVVFGIVSILFSAYAIQSRVAKICLENTIRFMAENDQLTGLKNRNSYEKFLCETSILKARSIFCVYVDVNGLHELNNTQGHEAGDRMLQYIATAMQNIFGKEETYRIGGDEYVALGINCEEQELFEKAELLKTAVETAGYHVAVGVCRNVQNEMSVDSIIKKAEMLMYEDKAAYYRNSNIDRRRNRGWGEEG